MIYGCLVPPKHSAQVSLGNGVTATLTGTPLFGFHSDWSREFAISDGAQSHSVDLFEDTGWWRGSNLYFYPPSTYALNGNPADFEVFTVDPLSFPERAAMPDGVFRDDTAAALGKLATYDGYPASRYHAGMFYVGRFVEKHRVPELRERTDLGAITFLTHLEQAELAP